MNKVVMDSWEITDCKHDDYNWDEFEDMYYCKKCNRFFLPIEFLKPENLKAGFRKIK